MTEILSKEISAKFNDIFDLFTTKCMLGGELLNPLSTEYLNICAEFKPYIQNEDDKAELIDFLYFHLTEEILGKKINPIFTSLVGGISKSKVDSPKASAGCAKFAILLLCIRYNFECKVKEMKDFIYDDKGSIFFKPMKVNVNVTECNFLIKSNIVNTSKDIHTFITVIDKYKKVLIDNRVALPTKLQIISKDGKITLRHDLSFYCIYDEYIKKRIVERIAYTYTLEKPDKQLLKSIRIHVETLREMLIEDIKKSFQSILSRTCESRLGVLDGLRSDYFNTSIIDNDTMTIQFFNTEAFFTEVKNLFFSRISPVVEGDFIGRLIKNSLKDPSNVINKILDDNGIYDIIVDCKSTFNDNYFELLESYYENNFDILLTIAKYIKPSIKEVILIPNRESHIFVKGTGGDYREACNTFSKFLSNIKFANITTYHLDELRNIVKNNPRITNTFNSTFVIFLNELYLEIAYDSNYLSYHIIDMDRLIGYNEVLLEDYTVNCENFFHKFFKYYGYTNIFQPSGDIFSSLKTFSNNDSNKFNDGIIEYIGSITDNTESVNSDYDEIFTVITSKFFENVSTCGNSYLELIKRNSDRHPAIFDIDGLYFHSTHNRSGSEAKIRNIALFYLFEKNLIEQGIIEDFTSLFKNFLTYILFSREKISDLMMDSIAIIDPDHYQLLRRKSDNTGNLEIDHKFVDNSIDLFNDFYEAISNNIDIIKLKLEQRPPLLDLNTRLEKSFNIECNIVNTKFSKYNLSNILHTESTVPPIDFIKFKYDGFSDLMDKWELVLESAQKMVDDQENS